MNVCRLTRVGNSTAVTIPAQLMQALGWKQGDVVIVKQIEGKQVKLEVYKYGQKTA